jgi:hypothetical protein
VPRAGALSLAIRAEALADEIDALHRDIRAARDEPVRRAGFRCDTASGWIRQAGTELHDTAGHFSRIAAAMKPRGLRDPVGRMPRAWQHPDQYEGQHLVPRHRVRPEVGLRPRRPAMHRARPVESDRQALPHPRDV